MSPRPEAFFILAHMALGMTQLDLGKALGISRRTAQRYSGRRVPLAQLQALARLVHPRDAALASAMAASAGTTLDAWGIAAPPPPAPVVVAPPAPPPPPVDGVVDAVVCAAAEAMGMTPRDVRPGLLAAFVRAREIGVTPDHVERVLRGHAAALVDNERSSRPQPRDDAQGHS